jgi:hypothetical protein
MHRGGEKLCAVGHNARQQSNRAGDAHRFASRTGLSVTGARKRRSEASSRPDRFNQNPSRAESVILKRAHRFSPATNAKRLRGDHGQAKR